MDIGNLDSIRPIIAGDGTATGNQVRRIIVRDSAATGAATAIALTGGRGGRATGNAVRGYAIEGNDLGTTITPNADGAAGNFVE